MKKTILLAILCLTTAGYPASSGVDDAYFHRLAREGAHQEEQAGPIGAAAGVRAAGAAAPGPMATLAGNFAGNLAHLQRELPTTVDANPNPTDEEDANPHALTFTPGDGLGTLNTKEDPQDRANRLFLDAAARRNFDVMRVLYSPGAATTPSPETVYTVLRSALEAGDYDFVRDILLHMPVQRSKVVAMQILDMAMERKAYALARSILNLTAANGRVPMEQLFNEAFMSGNMPMIKALLNPDINDRLLEVNTLDYLVSAGEDGNLDFIAYLLDPASPIAPKLRPPHIGLTLRKAVDWGHLNIVAYLLNPDSPIIPQARADQYSVDSALNMAGQAGHLNIVRYLLNPETRLPFQLGLAKMKIALEYAQGRAKLMDQGDDQHAIVTLIQNAIAEREGRAGAADPRY